MPSCVQHAQQPSQVPEADLKTSQPQQPIKEMANIKNKSQQQVAITCKGVCEPSQNRRS
jgi:hypothetical protein